MEHARRHGFKATVGATGCLATLAAVLVLTTASVAAAEVEFTISPEPYFVGAHLTLTVKVINELDHEPPALPEIKGADVRGPRKSTQQTIINFQVTQSVSYQYEIVPRQSGPLVIPPIAIVVKTRRSG